MKLMNKRAAVAVSTATVALALPLTALASFYPASRPTYACSTPSTCVGADHVVFDSFTNNPVVGDERPFFAGSVGGANVQDLVNVKDGDTVTLRAYVHNDADPNRIGVPASTARNVNVKVIVPTVSSTDQNLVAFISAANANPGTINDTMNLHGDRPFTVAYVPGSAKFSHKADGVNLVTDQVRDNIVGSNGTFLGDIKGCFQYSGYVTMQVKVSMPGAPVTTTTTVTPAPAPATVPQTGAETGLAAMAGTGALGYATLAYRRSRKALADALRK